MKQQKVESPWLTPAEAMANLKLGSRSALQRAIREQRLPYGRIGRLYRFDKRRLDLWIESGGEQLLTRYRSENRHGTEARSC